MAAPTVLLPGEGEKYFLVGDQITLKVQAAACGNAFAMVENFVAPQAGPPPHIHHREHEIFIIVEGELQMGLDRAMMTRTAGSVVFLPKGVPHVFKNAGDRPARLLVLAVPGGFDTFVAEAGFSVDAIPLPSPRAVGEADIAKLMSVCPKHRLEILPTHQFPQTAAPPPPEKVLWVLGHRVTLKAGSAQTQGVLSAVEVMSPPGAFVPPHSHRLMDEVFYVLEGTFRFQCAGGEFDAPAGTTVHVPPGVLHGFGNATGAPARLMDVHFPGGFEKFFEECGTPAEDGAAPPTMVEMDPAAIADLMDRHGVDMG